jgi:mannose-6-phosphate isomerase
LAGLLTAPLPDGPAGEAWILSDRDDHASKVANGPLMGHTISQLMEQSQDQLMGKLAQSFRRFPLLLKFLNAREMLSVQVHPGYTRGGLAPAAGAKTEAWVVLEAGNESRIYAGLHPGTTTEILEQSLANGSLAEHLSCITPKPGGGVFIPAGTVHSLGDDIVVFEIQQNNDVTFRLYDWGHVDAKTKQPRPLQIEQALACIDFADSEAGLVTAVVESEAPVKRERLFHCEPFCLWRLSGEFPFTVGVENAPRVLVCTRGKASARDPLSLRRAGPEAELPQERSGTIANVVFPTGIDRRDDLGCPNRFDVYYGMADSRIGVARLDLQESPPPGGAADPPEAKSVTCLISDTFLAENPRILSLRLPKKISKHEAEFRWPQASN